MNALELAIKYLSYKQRTEKELTTYLLEKELDDEEVKAVIEKLKAAKYINDIQYVKDYFRYGLDKKRGIFRIEMDLRSRGISTYDLEDGIFALQEEEGFCIDQVQLENGRYVRDRLIENRQLDKKLKEKLMRKLNYLGYSQTLIIKIMSEIL